MADTLRIDTDTEVVTLHKSRHAVCLEAAREIDAQALALPELVPIGGGGDDSYRLVVRGVGALPAVNWPAHCKQACVTTLCRRASCSGGCCWSSSRRRLSAASSATYGPATTLQPA